MQASAKIILDSISPWGTRLTTLEVVFWRPVLAEFNTHRVFSRNSASSRAIPIGKQIERVSSHCAYPIEWGVNQKGMQASEELSSDDTELAKQIWKEASEDATKHVRRLQALANGVGVHKQIANRLLEPFMWHTAIVSSTDWENFYEQRCSEYSPLAQPEMRAVSDCILEAININEPKLLTHNEWHLPYIQDDEKYLSVIAQQQISVARCARVSYLTHNGTRDITEDKDMYHKLLNAKPAHKSPFEHVAKPKFKNSQGNFKGWQQLRHLLFSC